jgi:hypothetical protein
VKNVAYSKCLYLTIIETPEKNNFLNGIPNVCKGMLYRIREQ